MNDFLFYPDRNSPNHSPHAREECDIIFITVCTKNRAPLLANERAHRSLSSLWKNSVHWLVGRYVLMPDHLHLFAQRARNGTAPLKQWIGWWKRTCSFELQLGYGMWQPDFWDTRMRSAEHYSSKWLYVRDNPVRKGLANGHDEWIFQGEIYNLKA